MKKTKIKAMGQHFLKDQPVLNKIIRSISPSKADLIIEIGAGKGALTYPLTDHAGKVIAIEKDASLVRLLQKKSRPNLTILEEDILKVNFYELIRTEQNFTGNVKLVGNLPYSLSSLLLFKVLREKEFLPECIFLLQKEVAERICAQPGTKKYAPLSILIQIDFFARLHFIVKPGCFSPPPKVDSALISLKKRPKSLFLIGKEGLFKKFLKGAFLHRRKILRNNLEKFDIPAPLINKAFHTFGIENNLRAEQLSISQFVSLFQFFFGGK
jgi:16S rRNA (adenine1518-N6/adenine1519-N6)-dimethyltransferase